jgi:two-component system chemotaxis response regulator CheB
MKNRFRTYDALAAGAVDVLEKPRGDDSDHRWDELFVSRLKMTSRIKVITHPRGRLDSRARASAAARHGATDAARAAPGDRDRLTGPRGVQILGALPQFPLLILFVVHVGAPSTSRLPSG